MSTAPRPRSSRDCPVASPMLRRNWRAMELKLVLRLTKLYVFFNCFFSLLYSFERLEFWLLLHSAAAQVGPCTLTS